MACDLEEPEVSEQVKDERVNGFAENLEGLWQTCFNHWDLSVKESSRLFMNVSADGITWFSNSYKDKNCLGPYETYTLAELSLKNLVAEKDFRTAYAEILLEVIYDENLPIEKGLTRVGDQLWVESDIEIIISENKESLILNFFNRKTITKGAFEQLKKGEMAIDEAYLNYVEESQLKLSRSVHRNQYFWTRDLGAGSLADEDAYIFADSQSLKTWVYKEVSSLVSLDCLNEYFDGDRLPALPGYDPFLQTLFQQDGRTHGELLASNLRARRLHLIRPSLDDFSPYLGVLIEYSDSEDKSRKSAVLSGVICPVKKRSSGVVLR